MIKFVIFVELICGVIVGGHGLINNITQDLIIGGIFLGVGVSGLLFWNEFEE